MKVQSLSVVVPNQKCINQCKFCVSRMSESPFKNQMDDNLPFFDLYMKDYIKRLEFARSNGCNTVMLTGNSEPQQNRKFLTYFGMFMQIMQNPFQWVEMQTTGVMIDDCFLRFLRNHVGVNTISLSVSAFDDEANREIIGMPNIPFSLKELCRSIKKYDFTLRLSLNMTAAFGAYNAPWQYRGLFDKCKELEADQVTLRGMYDSGGNTPQDLFVREHAIPLDGFAHFIELNAKPLTKLPYGATKYSYDGMSVVVDTDCMSKSEEKHNEEEVYKYLILRPNCKLYSSWDDPGSLIF